MAVAAVGAMRVRVISAVAATLLFATVLAVYAPVRGFGFVRLDDPLYVTDNPLVQGGLTLDGMRRAFVEPLGIFWMPLTTISHMADVSLFGADPGGPHVVSAAVHAACAVLVFLLFARTTDAIVASLFAAVLFALHPLRVESVAWIAERKDVVSVFFALLTMHAWVSWVRAPGRARWAIVVGTMALALLAKPMAVTLPVLLVCLDYWPLGRWGEPDASGRPRRLGALVREKLALFALAGGIAVATVASAQHAGAFAILDEHPMGERLAHLVVAYPWYVRTTLWPRELAVLYPLAMPAPRDVLAGLASMVGIGAIVWSTRRRAPWIAVGIAWFVIALLPVTGILQNGAQGTADRFTYLPSLGFVIAIVWTVAAIRPPVLRAACAGAGVIAVLALAMATRIALAPWHDSEALFRHALAVTRDNWMMEGSLADLLLHAGRPAEAIPHFAAALRIRPEAALAAIGLGQSYDAMGRTDDAIAAYEEALRIHPASARAHNALGELLARTGRSGEALHHFSEAVRFDPAAVDASDNLRRTLVAGGIGDPGAYLDGLRRWAVAIAADDATRDGAAYGADVPAAVLAARRDAVAACRRQDAAPFTVYLSIAADGGLEMVTAVPATAAAACVCDRLRDVRLPPPPRAPFHVAFALPI